MSEPRADADRDELLSDLLGQDAIYSGLEHFSGESVFVLKPCLKTDDGRLQFEEVFVTERTLKFFREMRRG